MAHGPDISASSEGVGKSCELFYEYPASGWLVPFDREEIKVFLSVMLEVAVPGKKVELHLVDDATIASMNEEFLGCTGPTNIITFPPDGDLPGSMHLSLNCLAREALLYCQDPATHFLRLLAHGCGHLAGLDHGEEMTCLEEACFSEASRLIG